MELRRSTWAAAIRLAVALSVIAVLTAIALRGLLPQQAIVLGVIVIGFTTSWVRTGQVARGASSPSHRRSHRMVTVPVHRIPVS